MQNLHWKGYGQTRSPLRLLLRIVGWISVILVSAAVIGWETLAVYYSNLPAGFCLPGAVLVAVISLSILIWVRPAGRLLLFFTSVFLSVVVWFLLIPPSNNRNWQTDVARLSWADISGNRVTVHNIRNFDYRTETDYTPAYYDRTFDMDKLASIDVITVYWMGPAIAHVLLSFGFTGGEYLAVSIETRKTVGEDYSTVKGFFRQYELYYVVADERDVIRLRTNYRHDPTEDVYIYRVQGNVENGRRVFLEYMKKLNQLKTTPEFYNTLTTNCTTNIWLNTRVNPGHPPFSWKILASGYLPEYLYECGLLDTSVPFETLRKRAYANDRAHAADTAPDFSRRIRTAEP